MKPVFLFTGVLLILTGCLRPDDQLWGKLNVTGIVTDMESGEPVPGAVVYLHGTTQKQGPIGYSDFDERLAADTADAAGAYSFSYKAHGETRFELNILPTNRHLFSPGDDAQRYTVTGIGDHQRNLTCVRTGFAGLTLLNRPPYDTTNVDINSVSDEIHLSKLVRDTTVFVRIYGDNKTPSQINFFADGSNRQSRNLTVGPGDTVNVRFEF
jgi:hypothetical protein